MESAADRYQAEVSDLLRSLSGAAVGAATVLVGTWIAMLGDVDVSATFLRVVVAVYAAYPALVPLLLRTGAARSQGRLIQRKLDDRRRRFVALLVPMKPKTSSVASSTMLGGRSTAGAERRSSSTCC